MIVTLLTWLAVVTGVVPIAIFIVKKLISCTSFIQRFCQDYIFTKMLLEASKRRIAQLEQRAIKAEAKANAIFDFMGGQIQELKAEVKRLQPRLRGKKGDPLGELMVQFVKDHPHLETQAELLEALQDFPQYHELLDMHASLKPSTDKALKMRFKRIMDKIKGAKKDTKRKSVMAKRKTKKNK